jgi:hypothetical protein
MSLLLIFTNLSELLNKFAFSFAVSEWNGPFLAYCFDMLGVNRAAMLQPQRY